MFDKLKSIAKKIKREVKVYQLVLKDRRTPRLAKFLLTFAVGYISFDTILDLIPVIGQLDDVIIVPVLVIIALKMIPKEVIEDCRIRVKH